MREMSPDVLLGNVFCLCYFIGDMGDRDRLYQVPEVVNIAVHGAALRSTLRVESAQARP